MFRKDVQQLRDIVLRNLRAQGLETPLLQKRLIDSWPEVAGSLVASYTQNLYIRNQTLFVHLTSPAIRADLMMMRKDLVNKLNAHVGSQVIADIKFN
jgi:predicted nucleic acid-binding Zn ribbon protein